MGSFVSQTMMSIVFFVILLHLRVARAIHTRERAIARSRVRISPPRAGRLVRVRIAYKYTIAIRVMRNYCRITETRIPSNTFFKHIMLQ